MIWKGNGTFTFPNQLPFKRGLGTMSLRIELTETTAQGAFDAVVRHLEALRHRSILTVGPDDNKTPTCMYRKDFAPTGLRCAIGALIRDEDYDPMLDRSAGGSNINTLITDLVVVTDLDPAFLVSLQRVHDDSYFWDIIGGGEVKLNNDGRAQLGTIAQVNHLVYLPVLT